MNGKEDVFQYILLAVFGIISVVALFWFRTGGGDDPDNLPKDPILIWGPPFAGDMDLAIAEVAKKNTVFENVKYVAKHPESMYGDLLEAMTEGRGPDLVIITQNELLELKGKLSPIPFTDLPLSAFRETFVEGAEVFAPGERSGSFALPLVVDPLVMYWNRDLFTNAAVAEVPKDWETFVRLAPKLSVIKDGADLSQGAVAFGEYDNVLHAKEILGALMMQAGAKIVDYVKGEYVAEIGDSVEQVTGAEAALRFFTDFSNPVKLVYSWNKTFDRSREAFAANKVAMYAGLLSEVQTLKRINPNLNYDVSVWPQSATGGKRITYGTFYGVARVKTARNPARAMQVMQALTQAPMAPTLQKVTGLPVTRRDALTVTPDDPYGLAVVQSAIIARAWLAPSRNDSDELFSTAINTVVSGSVSPSDATRVFEGDLNALLRAYKPSNEE